MPRQPTCACGECEKCKHREYMRRWYASKSPEERKAWVALRDPEKVKVADRARYYRNHEKRRAASDAYQRANPDRVRELKRDWAKRNPEKIRAQRQARRAMLRGEIAKDSCEVCGEEKAHMHHDDYTKPLEVRWLCAKHHGVVHRKEV